MDQEQYEIMRAREDSFWWYVGMRRITQALLAPVVSRRLPLRALDAGCGTGANLDFLRQYGTVVGLDIADAALGHCQLRGHHDLCKGSVQELPFTAGSFDLVTCCDVIYHEDVSNDLATLREFNRVLRDQGLLLVRVPAYNWLRGAHDLAVHTRHRYLAGELRSKIRAAGFRVVRVTHANSFALPMAIGKRLLESHGAVFGTDLGQPNEIFNRLLISALDIEARLIRRVNLPAGLSVIGVGVKECA